jgi:hypothetical protein
MYSPVAHSAQRCFPADLVETRNIDRNLMIILGPTVFHKRKWKMQEIVIAVSTAVSSGQFLFSVSQDGRVAQLLHGLLKPDTFTAFSRGDWRSMRNPKGKRGIGYLGSLVPVEHRQ